MKTFVNVNKHKAMQGDPRPIRVSRGRYGKPRYVGRFRVRGPATLVCDPRHPLPCGAKVWLEIG